MELAEEQRPRVREVPWPLLVNHEAKRETGGPPGWLDRDP